MTEQSMSTQNTYLIAVQSEFVGDAKVVCGDYEGYIEDASLVVSAAIGTDENAAMQKVSDNQDIPVNLLTAYEVVC